MRVYLYAIFPTKNNIQITITPSITFLALPPDGSEEDWKYSIGFAWIFFRAIICFGKYKNAALNKRN